MPLVTLTHARLRARQGDLDEARRIVRRILERDPSDCRARALLEELSQREARPQACDDAEPRLREPESVDSADIAADFRRELGRGRRCASRDRIRRLEVWLAKITAGEV